MMIQTLQHSDTELLQSEGTDVLYDTNIFLDVMTSSDETIGHDESSLRRFFVIRSTRDMNGTRREYSNVQVMTLLVRREFHIEGQRIKEGLGTGQCFDAVVFLTHPCVIERVVDLVMFFQ